MSEQGSILGAALAYGRIGLAAFPVAADCRRPLTVHGYKDASKEPATIEQWWRRWPNANAAVACGRVSCVFVLDVDMKGANGFRTLAELEAAHGGLARSWRTRTPSGGVHLWFRQPARELRNRVNFAPGLDCRTDGGSVAVPPSRKANGVYRWEIAPWDCPLADALAWLLNLIDPPPVVRPPRPPIRGRSGDRLANYVAAAIDGECREVAAMAPNTGRNLRLFKGAARLGELVGAGLAPEAMVVEALENAAVACGLVHDDGAYAVRASIRSGLARGAASPRELRR